MIYNGNSPWLDRSLKLSSSFEPFLSPIAESIAKEPGKRRKGDAVGNVKTALSVILANLLRSCVLTPSHGVRIDLSNDGYPMGSFNPYQLGIRAIRKVVAYLIDHNPPLIHRKGGNFDRARVRGYPTEIWISNSLKEIILIYMFNTKEIYNQPITRNTFDMNDYFEKYDMIFDGVDLPTIRLREGSSRRNHSFIEFQHTNETRSMESRLTRYNSFMSDIHLNLLLTDKEMAELEKRSDQSYGEFGDSDSDPVLIDLISGKKLYRVFNDGRFDHGGRFYGGWWQNVPKDYRRFITINGMPTIEVDFSSMQLAMLYAKVGEQLEGDAYAIDEIKPLYRGLIKEETLKLINAKDRMEPPQKSTLPSGWTWKELQNAIGEKHKPIAAYFRSGEGIRLQRLDSDIAEDVILRMMNKGVPVLPIHDSFIVAESYVDELSATMLEAYQQRTGGRAISLKRSPSLFDDLLAGQGDLSLDERYVLAMRLFQAKKEAPEYQGYRLREQLLGRAKPRSPTEGIEIRSMSQMGDGFAMPCPRAATAHAGGRGSLKQVKRLWDRSMGQGRAA